MEAHGAATIGKVGGHVEVSCAVVHVEPACFLKSRPASIGESDTRARAPAREQRWLERVVGEQEVVDGVRPALGRALSARLSQALSPLNVLGFTTLPDLVIKRDHCQPGGGVPRRTTPRAAASEATLSRRSNGP